MKQLLAKKATREDAHLKVMVWGEPGAGKSRLALSAPNPIVADLERSTRLYAAEFDFLIAEPRADLNASRLVLELVKEIEDGEYPDRQTLVIDPITDYLDALESDLIDQFAKTNRTPLQELTGMAKNKAYAVLRDGMRSRINRILSLPMHVIFVARAKNIWKIDGKSVDVSGRQPDAVQWLPYLCDVVIHLQRDGRQVHGHVLKSRLAELPSIIPAMTYADITMALQGSAAIAVADTTSESPLPPKASAPPAPPSASEKPAITVQAETAPMAPAPTPPSKPSTAALKRMFTMATKAEVGETHLKRILRALYGVTSSKDLTAAQVSIISEYLAGLAGEGPRDMDFEEHVESKLAELDAQEMAEATEAVVQ